MKHCIDCDPSNQAAVYDAGGVCPECGGQDPAKAPAAAPSPAAASAPAPAGPSASAASSVILGPLPEVCPDCKEKYQNGVCPGCGSSQEDARPKLPKPASVGKRAAGGKGNISERYSKSVSARPTTLGDLSTHAVGATPSKRQARTVATSSSVARNQLGMGLVNLPDIPRKNMRSILRTDVHSDGQTCVNNDKGCQAKHEKVVLTAEHPDCKFCDATYHNPTHADHVILRKDHGFCPFCQTEYWNVYPPGTMIGQYRVLGTIAKGGFGLIYGGEDTNVDGREVAIKTMLARDADSLAEAAKERSFLSRLKHPNVVQVYNFVPSPDGRQVFIIMEYVGGKTVQSLYDDRAAAALGPFPVDEAIAYIVGVLPGIGHLHENGVVFCDFKMPNFMIENGVMRLIDLGGACDINDTQTTTVCLSAFYDPPEIAKELSFSCDTYSVCRTLLLMISQFAHEQMQEYLKGGSDEFRHKLPTPEQEPLFAQYECLYRLLVRGCAADPNVRFQSAQELEDALRGVLRQVVAINKGARGETYASPYFSADLLGNDSAPGIAQLPRLKVQEDSAGKVVAEALAVSDISTGAGREKRRKLLQDALAKKPDSREARLWLADLNIECAVNPVAEERDLSDSGAITANGSRSSQQSLLDACQKVLDELAVSDPYDFRVAWLRGKLAIATGKPADAYKYFDACYTELPGEVGPQLAMAVAAQLMGDDNNAKRLYDLISRIDADYTQAAFNLAGLLSAQDKKSAVSVLKRVPATSLALGRALLAEVKLLMDGSRQPVTQDDLVEAAALIQQLTLSRLELHRLKAELFIQAAQQIAAGKVAGVATFKLLDAPLTSEALRFAAYSEYMQAKRFVDSDKERQELVRKANSVRPATWF